MRSRYAASCVALFLLLMVRPSAASTSEEGLVGHWTLRGDCRDHSGNGNHGTNHGVQLESGSFDGIHSYIEVAPSDALKFGTGDFTISAKVFTEKQLNDNIGDVLDLYDPSARRGITLAINSGGGSLQAQGTDRHVHFGIDNAQLSEWQDCGRPNPASNYVSLSMTVYKGKLYAATTGGKDEKDWRRVFRYEGDQKWTDCGQVGNAKVQGVGPLIVHNGDLYAATWTVDWTRVREGGFDPGRVHRYLGGSEWEDCGQPSDNRTLNCIASYQGKLFVGGGPDTYGVFTQDGTKEWKPSKVFAKEGPRRCFPHSMAVFNGKLFTGYPVAYYFDGKDWKYAGKPTDYPVEGLQLYCFAAHQGKLCVGTWPEGKVAVYEGGEVWREIGRMGEDGTEPNGLTVYNGKLYGGTLPRAEVCRYDGDSKWTSLKRFYSPDGWDPGVPYSRELTRKQVNEWVRLTSLTIYDGKLFASTASCTSSVDDAPIDPNDVRGKVFSMEAGKCVSYDVDLGPGWKHLVAQRHGGELKLFVDGKLVATSTTFEPADYDVSTDKPLRIGFGQSDYFAGRMSDVRIYNRALSEDEVVALGKHSSESTAKKASQATIVVASDASRVDRFAADELKKYLAKAIGWEVNISEVKATLTDVPVFFVGSLDSGIRAVEAFPTLPSADIDGLKDEGVIIKGDGKSVVLVGKGPRGGLYAVYEFLEEYVGCRWPEPGREHVPQLSSLNLQLDHSHNPAFAYRGVSVVGGSCTDEFFELIVDWQAKNRLNWMNFSCETYGKLRPKIIESVLDCGVPVKVGAHSRKYFYPSDKYFALHPEHFALVKGERTGDTQLCYSNHDSITAYSENIIEYLKANPEIAVIGLWPSDGYGFCECERCKSQPTTDVQLDYINETARRIRESLPHVQVEFLSYIHYTTPPETVKPLPYVIPTYCEYWSRNQFHPITDDRALNSKCRAQLEQWVKSSPQATIYSYYGDDTMKRFLYNPLQDVVLADLRYYGAIGAAGSTVLMMYPQSWWSSSPHLYAYAKGAWNNDSQLDRVRDDYFTSLYGAAADSMKKHQEAVRQLFDTEFGHGETGEEMLFGFRIKKFNPASESSSKSEFENAVAQIRGSLAEARSNNSDAWVLDRVNTLDQNAQLMQLVYGIIHESAAYKLDKDVRRKDQMRELATRLGSNEIIAEHDFRCKILASLMPHLIAVLGSEEAQNYDRVGYHPVE